MLHNLLANVLTKVLRLSIVGLSGCARRHERVSGEKSAGWQSGRDTRTKSKEANMFGNAASKVALRAVLLLVGLGGVHAAPAEAEEYPQRPIDFIVPWGVGGGSDEFVSTPVEF